MDVQGVSMKIKEIVRVIMLIGDGKNKSIALIACHVPGKRGTIKQPDNDKP